MSKPEEQNGGLDWEKELGDIDFKGFRNPEDLLNRVSHEQAMGTIEQRQIWQKIRESIAPYEERLHRQARSIIESPSLPDGVKKNPFSQKYSFSITDDSGQLRGVAVTGQRLRGNWFCKSFKIDNHSINFNKQGRISNVALDVRRDIDKKLNLKRTIQFRIERPDSMGITMPSGNFREVKGDGTIYPDEIDTFISGVTNSIRSMSLTPKE
jgi:hypothetical protein